MKKIDTEGAKQILQIVSGFRGSRVLLTASRFRVFDLLEKPATAAEIALGLSLDTRASEILLDALVSLDLLRKGRKGYQNTKTASAFLVTGTPFYQGHILSHYDTLWKKWSELDSVMKTGKPVTGRFDHRSFIMGMHNLATLKAPQVVSALELSGVKRCLDLGGGPGTYSIELAKRGLKVTLFDVKETVDIAREVVSSSRLTGSVDFMAGDFMTGDIGSGYDLVLISQILHSYCSTDIKGLIEKVGRALNPKGRIAIHEFLVNDAHTQPPQGALFAVNMLVNTEGGRTYSPSEIASMLRDGGFTGCRKTLLQDTVVVQARKTV